MLPSTLKQFVTNASARNVHGLGAFGVTESQDAVFGLSGIWHPDSQVLEITVGQRDGTGFDMAVVLSGTIGVYVTTLTQDPDTEPYLFRTLELDPEFLKTKPLPHWDMRLQAPIWPQHLVLGCELTTATGPVSAVAQVTCLDPSVELARYRVDHRFFHDTNHAPETYVIVDHDYELDPFMLDFTQADNVLTGHGIVTYSGGGNRWAQLRDQTLERQVLNQPLWGMDAHVFIEPGTYNYFGNTALTQEPTFIGNAVHAQRSEPSMIPGYVFRTGVISCPVGLNSTQRLELGYCSHADLAMPQVLAYASTYAQATKSRPEVGVFLCVDHDAGADMVALTDDFDLVGLRVRTPTSVVRLSILVTDFCPGDRVEYAVLAPQVELSGTATSRVLANAYRQPDEVDFAPETPLVGECLKLTTSLFHTCREPVVANTIFDTRNLEGLNGYWLSLDPSNHLVVGVSYDGSMWSRATTEAYAPEYGVLTTYCLWIDSGKLKLFRNNVVVIDDVLTDPEIPGLYSIRIGRDFMDTNFAVGEFVSLSADTSAFPESLA